ncbi:MAG: hypothetical protein HW390_2852 [Candidatus Brocadiaceae bacterium]|nr:hypothetical protein [Candidatus Brocadiaceae bacterium]
MNVFRSIKSRLLVFGLSISLIPNTDGNLPVRFNYHVFINVGPEPFCVMRHFVSWGTITVNSPILPRMIKPCCNNLFK